MLPKSRHSLERAIELYTMGVAIAAIARELNVEYISVWRWTKDKKFVDEVNARIEEMRAQRKRKIVNAANEAMTALQKLLRSPDERVVQQAAVTILERTDTSELKEAIEESKAVLEGLKSATKE